MPETLTEPHAEPSHTIEAETAFTVAPSASLTVENETPLNVAVNFRHRCPLPRHRLLPSGLVSVTLVTSHHPEP